MCSSCDKDHSICLHLELPPSVPAEMRQIGSVWSRYISWYITAYSVYSLEIVSLLHHYSHGKVNGDYCGCQTYSHGHITLYPVLKIQLHVILDDHPTYLSTYCILCILPILVYVFISSPNHMKLTVCVHINKPVIITMKTSTMHSQFCFHLISI